MTLLNSTYRRPRTKRPQPFEYDAILRQAGVLECFGVQESEYAELPDGCFDGLVRGACEFICARWEVGARTARMLAVAAPHCPKNQFKLLPCPAVFSSSRNAAQRSLHCPPSSPLSFFSTLLLDRVKLIPFHCCNSNYAAQHYRVYFGAYGKD